VNFDHDDKSGEGEMDATDTFALHSRVHADLRDESLCEVALGVQQARDKGKGNKSNGNSNDNHNKSSKGNENHGKGNENHGKGNKNHDNSSKGSDRSPPPGIVVLAKHLCADATDWALREIEKCALNHLIRQLTYPTNKLNFFNHTSPSLRYPPISYNCFFHKLIL
jgi:hypothetical protein